MSTALVTVIIAKTVFDTYREGLDVDGRAALDGVVEAGIVRIVEPEA